MKKNWIKVKRGLSEDPKHRERMGIRIWVFLHIVDRADWEMGAVTGWKDKDEAADMAIPWRTMQRQRQELAELGYITCEQKNNGQRIIIHNWTNPRTYSEELINPRAGYAEVSTQDMGEGTHEGTHEGTQELTRKVSTPSIEDHDHDHESDRAGKPAAPRHPAIDIFREKTRLYPDKAQWPAIEAAISAGDPAGLERWGRVVEAYVLAGWNKKNVGGMLEFYRRGEMPGTNGRLNGTHRGNGAAAVANTPNPVSDEGMAFARRLAGGR